MSASVVSLAQRRGARGPDRRAKPPAPTELSKETQLRLGAFQVAATTARLAPRHISRYARQERWQRRLDKLVQMFELAAAFIAMALIVSYAAERFL